MNRFRFITIFGILKQRGPGWVLNWHGSVPQLYTGNIELSLPELERSNNPGEFCISEKLDCSAAAEASSVCLCARCNLFDKLLS